MKRILVIDDETSVLNMIRSMLESAGYQTLLADSGAKGLELAKEHLPDLTLCDVNMPEMDGKALLQAFRSDADLAPRSFIMMTGDTIRTPQRSGMDLGADDYLAKPFKVKELLQCVETRLKRAELHWRMEERAIQEIRNTLHSSLPHEFFTPLAGILGICEILEEEAGDLSAKEISEFAAQIRQSGRRLHRTLRNYLKILELEQGDGFPEASDPMTPEEAQSVVESTIRSVTEKHSRLQDLILDLQPFTTSMNRESLALAVEELADNACSFSRSGTPIHATTRDSDSEGVLEISDRGRGMPAEQVAQIGAFVQFDRKEFEQQGLGLGLTLASRLLEPVGSRVEIKSAPGEGTTVTVRFSRQG